jgi:hypothetical protein
MTATSDTQDGTTPETVGHVTDRIPVALSTRFLHHFSEQLYSSPQKAFEELISNGWDAGADYVDVRVSADLTAANATLCILDNGVSMDADGLRGLWHIAFSPKAGKDEEHGRKLIGKFGIGKLATYVLASKLTYICKATDGKIRRVTMDYERIDKKKEAGKEQLINELELELFDVSDAELAMALSSIDTGSVLLDLINDGIKAPPTPSVDDEFGIEVSSVARASSSTWTLAVLTGLKPTGRELKLGVLRRMLEAALPFGSVMAVCLNGERLASSKLEATVKKTWRISTDLGITELDVDASGEQIETGEEPDPEPAPSIPPKKGQRSKKVKPEPQHAAAERAAKPPLAITAGPSYIDLPGVGRVTGTITLFEEKISGGKSDERGASNGFHVNVLGRVVNQGDSSFGEKNLSHAAWARFRMAVRADGLNQFLTTDREKFMERKELRIFRAFLRKAFNTARAFYDNDANAALPDGGDVLVKSLGVLSLSPLRNVVSETLKTQAPLPGLFDESGIEDRKEKRRSWREETKDNIRNALGDIRYERLGDESFVKFRLADNSIVVNKDHPFVAEHSRTKAEKQLLRTIAMVQLLTDVYAIDLGIDSETLDDMRRYRDRLMRFRAIQQRQSGTHLAKLLLGTQHQSDNSKLLERALSDALRYLGFHVTDLAKPGEPEGLAKAYPMPTRSDPTESNPHPPLYSISFDAKSSKHEAASTGNIKLDGVVEHRNRYKADHALVVAPGFEEGALATRCGEQKVTPMKASDLGRLLEYTVEHGAIPLTKLREIFQLYDPEKVTEWVDGLEKWLKKSRQLTIDVFLKALDKLKGKVPDVLSASTLAFACRDFVKVASVKQEDVIAVARGLSILVPDLVGIDGDKIVVNASAERVAAAVEAQLEKLHSDGFDDDSDTVDE